MSTTAISTVKLTLEVDLDLNETDVNTIKQNLSQIVTQAIENGAITQDTPAEIEDYRTAVVDASATRNLNIEDDIKAYLASEIEDGNQDLEGIPLRMARWGLMEPADFAADMVERIQTKDCEPEATARPKP